ncbi:MAG TPA: energy transducer TonB [Terriglobales bacterium]|nr:energy transducer TonB [Terriglobales bacterium]
MLFGMKVPSFVLALMLAGALVSFPAASAQTENVEVDGSRKVVSRVSPSYPAVARTMNLSGSVKLEIVVAPNGSVKSIQVIGGSPVFSQAAENALRAWRWEKGEHETTEHLEVRFKP